jgi:hypothetical protein
MRPDQLVGLVFKQSADVVSSLRRQAPAARMIGEFAVKHLVNEAEKLSRRFSSHERHTSSETNDAQDNDA